MVRTVMEAVPTASLDQLLPKAGFRSRATGRLAYICARYTVSVREHSGSALSSAWLTRTWISIRPAVTTSSLSASRISGGWIGPITRMLAASRASSAEYALVRRGLSG